MVLCAVVFLMSKQMCCDSVACCYMLLTCLSVHVSAVVASAGAILCQSGAGRRLYGILWCVYRCYCWRCVCRSHVKMFVGGINCCVCGVGVVIVVVYVLLLALSIVC